MHKISFYPVGNGDSSQIVLENGKRILLDFRQHVNGIDLDCPEIDLSKHLKNELNKVDRNDFDVVAFTHADKDHIQGCTEFFEFDHANKYQGDDRVKLK
jgi:ribonuclease BN (tRNA processing enzyme)